MREDRGLGLYDGWLADLALWEHRWTDADAAIEKGLAYARQREAAQIRVQVCAKGLRTQAELAALARARRDADALRDRLNRARTLLAVARSAAAEASAITPNATGWLALAEAEYMRTRAEARPEAWSKAATAWDQLERPPLAAYCRWRASRGARRRRRVAYRGERAAPGSSRRRHSDRSQRRCFASSSCSPSARASISLHPTRPVRTRRQSLADALGLTPREAEVLTLVARGYTNREIAAELVISVKTASVHVSHILRKLDAPNRREAAAIAHRVTPLDIAPP